MDSNLQAGTWGIDTTDDVIRFRDSLDIAAKAQRRADLVTLTAAALSGMLANEGNDGQFSYEVAVGLAVNVAEAALALIEERTK